MSKIRILSDALASQVAAGEVVERPAAVIRELVENSLDAGSSHITVEVQRGGTALIRVMDDGCGMNREDALLCIERHATSKIRTKEDLAAILTFGFRGEALPSIASVSRFRLATREKEALSGTEIEIQGGKLSNVKEYGGAPGTTIEARSLFYNVPARRKFLRTESTEFAHIEQQFTLHAIAHPEVTFTLIKDGAVFFHVPTTENVLDRIRGLAGSELAKRLLKVEKTEHRGLTVWGYIGGPGLSRSNKQQQLTFLNGRPIESPSITYGLKEGFHTSLMKGQYPVTYLFIEMEASAYDINVHPAKKEVRFHDGYAVRDAVARAVRQTLEIAAKLPEGHSAPVQQARPTPPIIAIEKQQSFHLPQTTAPLNLRSEGHLPLPTLHTESKPGEQEPIPSITKSINQTEPLASAGLGPETKSAIGLAKSQETSTSSELSSSSSNGDSTAETPQREVPQLRIIGVLHRLYILLESSEGLVLMDQHAAHERVNFEKMRRQMETGGVPSQRLLIPLTMQVTPKDADILRTHQTTLARLGIEVEPFGPNIFKVEALPTFLKTDEPLSWLDQVIEELQTLSPKGSSLRLGEDMIATTVCRHSIKANDRLNLPEIEALLKDLMSCEMPYCCPHGRPTLIQMSLKELEKKFGRVAPA